MTAFFAVGTLAEVAVKLEDCKRRDALKAEIAREKAAIIAANVAGSLEAARADPRAGRRGGAHGGACGVEGARAA